MNGTSEDTVKDAPTVLARRAMTCKTVPTSHAIFSQMVAKIATLGFQKSGRCRFERDCSYLHGRLIFVPLNTEAPPPMPPDPAVILTTHCIEEQIFHNPMYQQIIEQKQMISSLQNQLSVQQEKMSALEVNVKNLTNSFNERINEKVAEGTSTLCEKVEKLEEFIPSINSRITSLINNSISSEGVSSLINNSMIKFGDQENTIQTLKTKVDDVGAQLTR